MKIKILLGLVLLLLGCNQAPHSKEEVTLHNNWQFVQEGKNNWQSASVPGVVHTDLLAHNMIPHPWIGTNEDSVQWIENENWVYRTRFDLSTQNYNREVIELVFQGLDTYAQVFINNSVILDANNMFRTWRVDVKQHLKIGTNELNIVFKSPIERLSPVLEKAKYELPASSESVSIKVSPYIRKAPYHFGWDWGPRLVTAGVWRPVFLQFWDEAIIHNVQIVQHSLNDDLAKLSGKIEIFSTAKISADLSIMGNNKTISLDSGVNNISIDFEIADPKKWWPNGWGEPNLYEVPVRLSLDNHVIDEAVETIGLRTIELIQKNDSIGESFYFKVNGSPLFAKGANYIPQSHFLPDVTDKNYHDLIADVKSANMNMLRVWGGGAYESDEFYQLCDENGILVWQDFMFANTMYPGDSAFMNNVESEIIDNVKRLRNHPSIAHWNGNNEIDVAWHNWGWQNQFNYSTADSLQIWHDYLKLFHELIPNTLQELDVQRSYTTTSPLSNWGTPANFNNGSMHYWGVWHGREKFEEYSKNVGRFMSEYGFQSFPSIETIEEFSDSSQWSLESEVMKHHQKSYVGNGLIAEHIGNHFKPFYNFKDFVEKSQETQALGMKIAIDAHRLKKGHCWGSLFWQLNDCWPGPSWSSRDIYSRKKSVHDHLSTLFAPIALIPEITGDSLRVWLVNDLPTSQNINAQFEILNKDMTVINSGNKLLTTSANELLKIWNIESESLQQDSTLINLTITDSLNNTIYNRSEWY